VLTIAADMEATLPDVFDVEEVQSIMSVRSDPDPLKTVVYQVCGLWRVCRACALCTGVDRLPCLTQGYSMFAMLESFHSDGGAAGTPFPFSR
jgi:hypothetical protein